MNRSYSYNGPIDPADCTDHAYAGSLTATEACERQSPINEALSRLSSAESHLYGSLDELVSRLGVVLTPEPGKDGDCPKGEPVASELHGRLLGDAAAISACANRIDGLLRRLTL